MALFTSLARAASKLGTRITAVGTSARAALLWQTIVGPKVTPGRLLTGRREIERGLAEAIKLRQSPSPRLIAHLRHLDGQEAVLTSG